MQNTLGCLCVLTAVVTVQSARAGEDVLLVEQEYKIVEHGKDGVEAKDSRQKLYMSEQAIKIDEFRADAKMPHESILVLLKDKKIITLDHGSTEFSEENFEEREKRLGERKRKVKEDIEHLPPGPQRVKLERLYRAMLDDERMYETGLGKEAGKDVAKVPCTATWVSDAKNKDYVPFKGFLHPEIEVPYNTAEVLYLLKIIGAGLKDYLNKNPQSFRKLPMEMELDLAAGGTLKTKVLSFEKTTREQLGEGIFEMPPGYKKKPSGARKPPPESKTPDTVDPDQ